MNRAIEWFAKNTVAANLMMVIIIVAGLFSLSRIKLEVFPEFSSDMISVSVPYLGAAPEETEEGVVVRVEEAVQDLEGIKKITSTAAEGAGSVMIEVLPGFETRQLLDDVKSRVDAITTFPVETEKPIIQELLIRRQVINVAISGETDEKSLKSIGEQIRDELSDLKEISQVELAVARPYEISIEVSEEALRRYGLTFDELAQAVRMTSLDMPGGSIKASEGEILLRTKGQAYLGKEFENLILRSFADGTRLRLGDVATVVDGFADTDQSARFNGLPTVLVQIYRVGNESALEIAEIVKAYVADTQPLMPEGIELTTWQDDSKVLQDRLGLLLRNGRSGFILVFIALALFLKLRLAWWVTVGMVISFFGAFFTIPQFDVSINLLSLFAFILVLGIVVDDAIVIGENIYTHIERGEKGLKAAINGTQEVAVPVTFAILTTVAAFSPLLVVPGNTGKIFAVIPVIVISVLLFSLLEGLFILPAHLSHIDPAKDDKKSTGIKKWWQDFQTKFADRMRNFVTNYYRPALEIALRWRYLTVSIGIAIFIFSISLAATGWVKFVFFPNVDADNVVAKLRMPQGTSVVKTSAALERLEASARRLKAEYNGDSEGAIKHIMTTVGEQPSSRRPGPNQGPGASASSNIGEVNLQLFPSEVRGIPSPEIARRWREITGAIPDIEELSFTSSLFSAGEAINIQLAGANYENLQLATDELKNLIAQYPGVFDITDSFSDGKQEIKLKIKPEAEALGLTLADLARQVRQAFYGEEAQRIQRGRDDIRVMIRYPADERKSLGSLENMRVRLPGGVEIPFSSAAEATIGQGFSTISRTDRKRTISVMADVDVTKGNANEIMQDITANVLPGLLAKYRGVTYSLEGEQAEQQETMGGLARGFVFALLIIYILLAIPFRSYWQPFVVMSAIPFGIVGAIWGHLFMGMNLTILSGFGLVALTGVVVNDSLVMVDFINRARAKGHPLLIAIREAGAARFRPITLTSVTTFAGLTPLLLEKSLQAQFLIPMAISLAFGVLFATFITLVLVPSIYHIFEDARIWVYGKLGRTVVDPATGNGSQDGERAASVTPGLSEEFN